MLQAGPGTLAVANCFHRRLVLRAPVVGQFGPVGGQAIVAAKSLQLPDQTRAPIYHGSENVKEQSLDGHGESLAAHTGGSGAVWLVVAVWHSRPRLCRLQEAQARAPAPHGYWSNCTTTRVSTPWFS